MIRPLDLGLGLAVAVIWGLAFVETKIALQTFTAPQLAALRFLIAAAPVLFLARPQVPWRVLVPIGLTLYAGQFLFQFYGIAYGMPPGLASVIVQTQAVYTVLFAMALGERATRRQMAGIAGACVGLGLIAATIGQGLTLVGFCLTMVSPISFGIGNILLKRLGRRFGDIEMVNLVTWLSLVVPLPMLALSLHLDGPEALTYALTHATWRQLAAVLYLGAIATTLAYAVWGKLLHAYAAAQVAPFALLVPIVAALASSIVFGEEFGPLRLAGMACVLTGLTIIVLPRDRLRSMFVRS